MHWRSAHGRVLMAVVALTALATERVQGQR
jgi:hypothetical protein